MGDLKPYQNNRYDSVFNKLQAEGRCKYCGAWTIRGYSLDGRLEKLIRLDCKRWVGDANNLNLPQNGRLFISRFYNNNLSGSRQLHGFH